MTPITTLKTNEVFVFGSNRSGFHGAGSAGLACRGDASNTWRDDPWFLRAMKAPVGSLDRVGKWAVYGVGRGWQQGREGMSYAIQTIERPGLKRSTPLDTIIDQLGEMLDFASDHPGWTFLMTPIGAGLSGYAPDEMAWAFGRAIHLHGCLPGNVIAPDDLYEGVDWRQT